MLVQELLPLWTLKPCPVLEGMREHPFYSQLTPILHYYLPNKRRKLQGALAHFGFQAPTLNRAGA